MNDEEKDELDLLADAEEDTVPLWAANVTLKNLDKAKSAVYGLIKKGWVNLWWVDAKSMQRTELQGEELDAALEKIQNDEHWIVNQEQMCGYFGFFITESGLAYYQTNPQAAEYMNKEWKQRAIERGHMSKP